MELPKEIIQVGEANPSCKVYVEDYAVSFLKQQNRQAADQKTVVALYGKTASEDDKTYVFIYGAAIVKSIQKETRHLSQAQNQELEKIRKKYFRDYAVVGYRLLDGEMIEGMHICDGDCDKGAFRYVEGYAQFYEKNDIMLTYMLEYKGENAQPEVVDQTKYEIVKKRQEERKARNEGKQADAVMESENPGLSNGERDELKEAWSGVLTKQRKGLHRMQFATAAVFLVLCLVGIFSMGKTMEDDEDLNSVPVNAPASVGNSENVSVIRTDEKLTEALQNENKDEENSKWENPPLNNPASENSDVDTQNAAGQNSEESRDKGDEQTLEQQSETPSGEEQEKMGQESESEKGNGQGDNSEQDKPVIYVIKKGDTLMGISLRIYGNTSMVRQICTTNKISNPDDIKVGQRIVLP